MATASTRCVRMNRPSFRRKPGIAWRIPGTEALVIIEVQCGDYLGEDDIVRLEDRYGRVKA